MKIFSLLVVASLAAIVSPAQPMLAQPRPPMALTPAAAPVKDTANYLIRVEWKETKGEAKSLEILTTEGSFSLDTIQKNSVKINGNDIPTTLKFSGSLAAENDQKGRLQLFLGRTVPYITGSGPSNLSSYSQMSVGLNSTFVVNFGKAQVVQSDENGEISVLVKRIAD